MKRAQEIVALVLFWLGWPVLWLAIHDSNRVRVLVCCGTKVLVIKSRISNGDWGLPGGGCHAGESTMAAAVRELKEETGIKANPNQLIPLVQAERAKEEGISFVYDGFLLELAEKPVLKLSRLEIRRAEWLDKTQLLKDKKLSSVTRTLLNT